MKKLLTLGIILATFCLSQAQIFTIAGKDIGFLYVGPKFGMGTSFISNYTQDGQDTKLFLNVVGGVVGKFGITERLSIQPEIIFTRKGGKSYDDEFKSNQKTIAQYIGIPILAKLQFIKIGDIKLHGSGGFYTNVTTKQEVVIEYEEFNETYNDYIEKDFYKTVDFGLSLGGGAEYDLGFGLLVGELLIDHGFVDNYENDFVSKSNRHTSVAVAFTFLYNLGELIK
jgi:hypothetical protein